MKLKTKKTLKHPNILLFLWCFLIQIVNLLLIVWYRDPLVMLDPPVLLVLPARASTCQPLPVWVRPRSPLILSGTWGPTRPPALWGSTTLRWTPVSSPWTIRSRTCAAPTAPRRTLHAPATTWNCVTPSGRVVSSRERNQGQGFRAARQTITYNED